MSLRNYLLDAALERVISSMSLRRPQHEAIGEFHALMRNLPDQLGNLSSADLRRLFREFRPEWQFAASSAPHLSFMLATGVGKSKLMAGLIAYLSLAGESRSFLILASRRTVVDKFRRELSATDPNYLFVDPSMVPNARIWHADNVSAFRDDATIEGLFPLNPVNVFVLSPQSLVGDDRKISTVDEFTGVSVLEWLKNTQDLVVLSDEAHHLGRLSDDETAAWTRAVRELDPRLHLLFTATPPDDANELYSYDLVTCLREKLYTKDVRVVTRQRPDSAKLSDEEWDYSTLEFALGRLERKRAAVLSADDMEFPAIEPVVLICCVNTNHADTVADWLVQSGHLTAEEVLVAHSKRGKSDETLQLLLNIDKPGSKIRAVVTVFQLTEGWDVSNVFVIAPLRAMATFTGAVQTLGRGLRLPAGHRVEVPELDTLDMLCFGRESLDEILAEATDKFGDLETAESPIEVTDADSSDLNRPIPTKQIEIPLAKQVVLQCPRMRIAQTEPDLDFEPDVGRKLAQVAAQEFSVVARVVTKAGDAVTLPRSTFVALTVEKVISALSYLSTPLHTAQVAALVESFLDAAAGDKDAEMIAFDWRLAGEMLARQIDAGYRKIASATFTAVGTIESEVKAQKMYVPETWEHPFSNKNLHWSASKVRQPIGDWKKCTHRLASFDTRGEFHVARILDRSDVDWWLRNDPAIIRIATPIGYYGPDFVVSTNDGRILLVELKGTQLWEPPDSNARIKGAAADAYCEEVTSATALHWEHWMILDEDAKEANSLEELSERRINEPVRQEN